MNSHDGMDINSFLDMAYKKLDSRPPVTGSRPAETPLDLLWLIDKGRTSFRALGAAEPFAVLLNPEDKLGIEMFWSEVTGVSLFECPEETPDTVMGMIMQPAQFIQKGMYLIVNEQDYQRLREINTELH